MKWSGKYVSSLFLVLAVGLLTVQAKTCHVLSSHFLNTDLTICDTKNFPNTFSSKDRDGDGVKDENDLCPDLKGNAKNQGCPEITIEVWTSFYVALSDVNFAKDSDTLSKESSLALNTVADLMKVNKGFILKLGGYADSLGTKEHNKVLSEKRAEAVKHYLVEEAKINPKRIKLASYGEKMPKAPNTTASGRAINRRVEFDIFY